MSTMNAKEIAISQRDIKTLETLRQDKSIQAQRVYFCLCDLFLIEDLKGWVRGVRKTLRIPPNGYSRNDILFMNASIYYFREHKKPEKNTLFRKIELSILDCIFNKEYFVSIRADKDVMKDWISIIRNYIIFGDINASDISSTEITFEVTSGFNNRLKIVARADIRQEELIRDIKNKWGVLKEYGRVCNIDKPPKQKLKVSKSFERDVEIYNKYIEVLNRDHREHGYIESIIAKEANDELNLKLTGTNVKKIIERMKMKVNTMNSATPK
jgi:hypothetical protein